MRHSGIYLHKHSISPSYCPLTMELYQVLLELEPFTLFTNHKATHLETKYHHSIASHISNKVSLS